MNTLKQTTKFKLPAALPTKLERWNYMQVLERDGYEQIGCGSFADVYSKRKLNTVLKIGRVNGDSYMRYVERIGLMSANVHFPKIHSVTIYDTDMGDPYSDPYYVVEMEKLHSLDQAARVAKIEYAFEERQKIVKSLGIHDIYDLSPSWIDNVFSPSGDFTEAVQTLKFLYDSGAGCDVTDRNVMYRVSANKKIDLVLTDPVV